MWHFARNLLALVPQAHRDTVAAGGSILSECATEAKRPAAKRGRAEPKAPARSAGLDFN